MDLDDAVRILKTRYGVGAAEYIAADHIHVRLPLIGSELLHTFILSEQQASYLAGNPITGNDFKAQRFPPDWPSFPS